MAELKADLVARLTLDHLEDNGVQGAAVAGGCADMGTSAPGSDDDAAVAPFPLPSSSSSSSSLPQSIGEHAGEEWWNGDSGLQYQLGCVSAKHRGSGPQTGIFTDGGCSPNPGRGGWASVAVADGQVLWRARGSAVRTTNNRMEMSAISKSSKKGIVKKRVLAVVAVVLGAVVLVAVVVVVVVVVLEVAMMRKGQLSLMNTPRHLLATWWWELKQMYNLTLPLPLAACTGYY